MHEDQSLVVVWKAWAKLVPSENLLALVISLYFMAFDIELHHFISSVLYMVDG
jgi:hypothetical protein